MKTHAAFLAVCCVLFALQTNGLAQIRIVTLETRFDTDLAEPARNRLRQAIQEGLTESGSEDVLSEETTREVLGSEGDRLMTCTGDPQCYDELAQLSQATAALVFSVSETGQIYTFTVDAYALPTGDGLYFSDADCPLCTVEEAAGSLGALARTALTGIPGSGAVVAPEVGATLLIISVNPREAEIHLDESPIGTGEAEVNVVPGMHRLRVALTGYETAERDIEIAEGSADLRISVTLSETEPSTMIRRQAGLLDGVDTTAWGSVIGGVGLVSLITGAVLLALDGDPSCSEGGVADCAKVYDTFPGGLTLALVGTAAVTSGVILLLWDRLAGSPETESGPSQRLSLGLQPSGLMMVIESPF